jgi:hypothetical protein
LSKLGFLEASENETKNVSEVEPNPPRNEASESTGGVKTIEPLKELEVNPEVKEKLDIDKLAYSVAMVETKDCTAGMGRTKNNCFGIMTWINGKRTGKYYPNKDAAYEEFKQIWKDHYEGFPNYTLAKKWTGNDNTKKWLSAVNFYYSQNYENTFSRENGNKKM